MTASRNGKGTKHKRAVDEAVRKLRARCRRLIQRRLRDLERTACVQFVALRLDRKPSEVREMLYGTSELPMDQISDLGIAVGAELKFTLRPKKK